MLYKCNKMFAMSEMRQEDSIVNNLYLHNEKVAIKQFRGVVPMLVSWCHVKHHVKFTLKQVLTKVIERARM